MQCKFSVANTKQNDTKQNKTKKQMTFHLTPFVAFAGLGWTAFKSVNKMLIKQKVYVNCWS